MSNDLAQELKRLHTPASPIVFANVWDLASLNAVRSLNTPESTPVRAIATASWAIAAALGVKDEDLTLEQNMAAIAQIAPAATAAGLPLSVDLQDGYGEQIEDVVASAVGLGAVGANIEDSIPSAGFGRGIDGSLYGLEAQVVRLRRALAAARAAGCADFVLNARCDVFRLEPYCADDDETALREAARRGRAYLEAGATTVFFWGGSGRGLRTSEVQVLVRELGGRARRAFDGAAGRDRSGEDQRRAEPVSRGDGGRQGCGEEDSLGGDVGSVSHVQFVCSVRMSRIGYRDCDEALEVFCCS
ncbi:Putative pyruvate/Phosphoenolpyruvate kinase-like domain superfamily [Colletotrichum destructivum]|uniref:Pyruvate/Phosphoenolpyruvate kinase-like domain superfamily n=1 Tax=Colletotrichum destructivum TaxID=34406 RepID=A0AAX4I7U9_9PEZI|nr:Putative pyruvate/Phosphoenolpyruvate kinase-like domain superfamily [Colletotrichum destructivum]